MIPQSTNPIQNRYLNHIATLHELKVPRADRIITASRRSIGEKKGVGGAGGSLLGGLLQGDR